MRLEVAEMAVDVQGMIDAERGDAFWQYAAETWHGLYAPYVPWDTGALYRQVEISPAEIWHTVSYAERMYEGGYDFRKDVHPLATGRWDEAAKAARLPLLVAAMQEYVDAGRLNIGRSNDS